MLYIAPATPLPMYTIRGAESCTVDVTWNLCSFFSRGFFIKLAVGWSSRFRHPILIRTEIYWGTCLNRIQRDWAMLGITKCEHLVTCKTSPCCLKSSFSIFTVVQTV
jgi:hypothetical protein